MSERTIAALLKDNGEQFILICDDQATSVDVHDALAAWDWDDEIQFSLTDALAMVRTIAEADASRGFEREVM